MRPSHAHETVMIVEKITKPNGEHDTKKYTIGPLLGKGGFGQVFEVTDISTHRKMAGKVIPKTSMLSNEMKHKLVAEINTQKTLKHPNIVRLETAFEDKDNLYMLIELCSPQTLNDYLQRKQRLNEVEVQHFLLQLIEAVKYLHSQRIIHRDIKLKNLLLTDDNNLKLGDFGLSVKLSSSGERRKTVCGTPNYVAPEILNKTGHSYEVDIWALGVVMYYLLVGVAPFDNPDNKIIYKKIKEGNYAFPLEKPISADAMNLISRILVLKPENRPTLDEILQHPFFTHPKHVPRELRKSLSTDRNTLKSALKKEHSSTKQIFVSVKSDEFDLEDHKEKGRSSIPTSPELKSGTFPLSSKTRLPSPKPVVVMHNEEITKTVQVKNRNSAPGATKDRLFELEKPIVPLADAPFLGRRKSEQIKKEEDSSVIECEVYVAKWLDYASKYGIGYTLTDGSIGVIFNDQSKMLSQNANREFLYIEDSNVNGTEKIFSYSFDRYPDALEKKIALFKYFKDYLDNNKSGVSVIGAANEMNENRIQRVQSSDKSMTAGAKVYVSKWIKTKQAIFFKLNTKVMQIVFKDGVTVTLKPATGNVEYLTRGGERSFYGLNDALVSDDKEVAQRMTYVQETLKEMWKHRNL